MADALFDPPPLKLYYIDTRPLSDNPSIQSDPPPLPLLSTLRPEDQTSVTRFLRPPDRHMSLASALLKYLFIHRTAKIPWSEVVISRTPAPHKRPFWEPGTAPNSGRRSSSNAATRAASAVEFNLSHQAGLVTLAGCATDSVPDTVALTADGPVVQPSDGDSKLARQRGRPRIGIDITCVSESSRRGSNHISTPSQFREWVEIFGEVFSEREMEDMKSHSSSPSSLSSTLGDHAGVEAVVQANLRRFYTFWALKEAYIKMTGEALLAGWLRELEFKNVKAPPVAEDGRWGKVEEDVEIWFRGRRVKGLRVELVGFGKEYVVAMVVGGLVQQEEGEEKLLLEKGMKKVDIEEDVRACAEGRCRCLDNDG